MVVFFLLTEILTIIQKCVVCNSTPRQVDNHCSKISLYPSISTDVWYVMDGSDMLLAKLHIHHIITIHINAGFGIL